MIKISFSQAEIEYIKSQSMKACIGGSSNIREDDRQQKLEQDQFIGMAGQYALSKYWYGSVDAFRVQRYYANLYKFQGDGGSDIPRSNIDIKTSRRTNPDMDLYHLWVREREYKPDTVYILGVYDEDAKCVFILGWAIGGELQKDITDRYAMLSKHLHKLPPVIWTM